MSPITDREFDALALRLTQVERQLEAQHHDLADVITAVAGIHANTALVKFALPTLFSLAAIVLAVLKG